MAEEAPNAALSGNRKTSMLSRISQGAAVIVQGRRRASTGRGALRCFTQAGVLVEVAQTDNQPTLRPLGDGSADGVNPYEQPVLESRQRHVS